MDRVSNALLLAAVAVALTGCGRSRGHDLAACREASAHAGQAGAGLVADEVGACMMARGYRRDTYTNGCAAEASPAAGRTVRADCWLAPGQAPANYPFPRDNPGHSAP